MKYAIQVIGLGTPISAALRKELEQEADLILNCQTVAANCETLLSTAGKSKDEVCLPNIPKKELVIQESKEQASPKSETASILSEDGCKKEEGKESMHASQENVCRKASMHSTASDQEITPTSPRLEPDNESEQPQQ